MKNKEISRFGNLNVLFPAKEIEIAMDRHKTYGKSVKKLDELAEKLKVYTLKDFAYDLISNAPEAGLLYIKNSEKYTREQYMAEWEKISPINEAKRRVPFFFITDLATDEKRRVFESFSVPALIEFITVVLNSSWQAYNKDISWLTPEEKVMWDDALSGKNNEWSFVKKAIENFQESGYRMAYDDKKVKTNISYFRIFHILEIISSKRGSGQYKKKIDSSPEMLHTLYEFGINFFTAPEVFKQLKSIDVLSDFISLNLELEINKRNAEYDVLKQSKNSKVMVKDLSRIINFFGYLAFSAFSALSKHYSEEVFSRLEKLIAMLENDFNYKDEKSSVEGVKNICDFKSMVYKKRHLHPRFNDFYWVKEMSQINMEAVPVERVQYDTLTDVLKVRLKRNVEKALGIKMKEIEDDCFDCFLIKKEDITQFHTVKFKESLSYAEIQSKIRTRLKKSLDKSNEKEEWLNSFDLVLQNTKVLCYFYDSKMPKDFRVSVTENLIQRAVSESFKKNSFSLDETIMLKEDGWMRYELKQANKQALERPQKIRKF